MIEAAAIGASTRVGARFEEGWAKQIGAKKEKKKRKKDISSIFPKISNL